MKTEKKANILKIILAILIFSGLICLVTISQAAFPAETNIMATKKGDGYLIRYVEDKVQKDGIFKPGSNVYITTRSLSLPYIYCKEVRQVINYATYTPGKLQTVNNNNYSREAYILSTKSQRSYENNSNWKRHRIDATQIAEWLYLNGGKTSEFDEAGDGEKSLYTRMKEFYTDLGEKDPGTAATNKINEGLDLYKEAAAFQTYRNNYKKASVTKNNAKLGNNNVIGPFQVEFTTGSYTHMDGETVTNFGGWIDDDGDRNQTPFTLTAVMADGSTKTLANDGTDWSFVDKDGNAGDAADNLTPSWRGGARPTSGKDFYIKIRDPEVISVKSLTLNFKQTSVLAHFYNLYPISGDSDQNLLLLTDAKKEVFTETLNIPVNVDLQIKLAGHVFLDNPTGKDLEVNGIMDNSDTMLSGITVNLRKKSDNSIVATTKTDSKGYYEFKVNPDTYYVEFIYDGQNYEPTTYNTLKKEIADNLFNNTSVSERSYATDGKANRQAFNAVYAEIKGDVARSRNISAYTGKDGMKNLKTYNASSSTTERENINLGLMEREKTNITLSKDLWDVKVTINGKSETYIYNSRNDEDMTIALRGSEVEQYERAIRSTDIGALENIEATYRIRLYNASGYINTEVTELVDFYDTAYTLKSLSTGTMTQSNGDQIAYHQEQANGYNKIRTDNYASGSFTSGDSKYIYATYSIDPSAVQGLIDGQEFLENYAEIGGYKTYYVDTRKDLNNDIIMHEAGEIAGLVDINSEPNNFDPNNPGVQEFVERTRNQEYTSEEEKQADRQKTFQDDADVAPGLRLTISDDERTISGNVWDDITSVDDQGIRKGNGELDARETGINGIKVQLIEKPNYNADNAEESTASQEDRTHVVQETEPDENGYYSFSGFLPGDYYVRFTYGDETALAEYNATYNGQDYKSTLYSDADHDPTTYWYTNTDIRASDATDNMNRRNEVNNYSREITNQNATVLNKGDIPELAKNTWMYADTATMIMEVEYATTQTSYDSNNKVPAYNVKYVDFGLAERPHSQLDMEKTVSRIRMYTTDGQTIFDSTGQTTNLAWIPNSTVEKGGGYIQATVDNSLVNGAQIQIDYTMTVTNNSETNYVQVVNGTTVEDENFYKTGTPGSGAQIAKTQVTRAVDYVENNLEYNAGLNKKADGTTDSWNTVAVTDLNGNIDSNVVTALANWNTVVEPNYSTDGTGEEIYTALEPGQSTNPITLSLRKTGMTTGGTSDDDLQYANSIEIIKIKEDAGRRQEEGTVGNYDPTNPDAPIERDTGIAEEVTVLPPFGNSNIYYLIGAIAIVIVLGVGIFFIIRKVVPKKK